MDESVNLDRIWYDTPYGVLLAYVRSDVLAWGEGEEEGEEGRGAVLCRTQLGYPSPQMMRRDETGSLCVEFSKTG
jgi:hypothetical protein